MRPKSPVLSNILKLINFRFHSCCYYWSFSDLLKHFEGSIDGLQQGQGILINGQRGDRAHNGSPLFLADHQEKNQDNPN